MNHSFDTKVAEMVGVNAAVLFENIKFWIIKNQANGRYFSDGRYWTYNSVRAFSVLFPYLSQKQCRTALEKLVDANLVIRRNYNEKRYDRTFWYSFGSEAERNRDFVEAEFVMVSGKKSDEETMPPAD